MQLSAERKGRIQHRLSRLLKEYDSELEFITVFVDSSREDLGIVVQLGEQPLLLKFRWVDFISNTDDAIRGDVFAQLDRKLGNRRPGRIG
jgi:hypothetical protein